jgi:hypothetical protein
MLMEVTKNYLHIGAILLEIGGQPPYTLTFRV